MRNVSSLEALYKDYAPRGVHFYYVYKTLAHPETNGYVRPYTLQERLLHVRDARRRLRTQFRWICDSMDNQVKHALGDAPNSEFVIDPDGKVARKRVWSRPEQLRADLEELVGPVEHPTKPEDVDVGKLDGQRTVATGVVPRVKPDQSMRPLRIEPLADEEGTPFYVKLRAEADDALLGSGQGQLYLGFHLDPVHRVHWNNTAAPLEYELSVSGQTQVTPQTGTAADVDVAADADPREFLVDVASAGDEPLQLTVRYFACDDADEFCVAVQQRYTIHLGVDPEGGWVFSRGSRPTRRSPRVEVAAAPAGDANPTAQRLLSLDRDGDGRISRDEAPEMLRRRFERIDTDADGQINSAELTAVARRWEGRFAQQTGEMRDSVTGSDETQIAADVPEENQTAFSGRLRGQLRGWIKGRLKGNFRGSFRGHFADDSRFDGQFEGTIDGPVRGEFDGEFDGEFTGTLGGPP